MGGTNERERTQPRSRCRKKWSHTNTDGAKGAKRDIRGAHTKIDAKTGESTYSIIEEQDLDTFLVLRARAR